jgi:hypothetical protein
MISARSFWRQIIMCMDRELERTWLMSVDSIFCVINPVLELSFRFPIGLEVRTIHRYFPSDMSIFLCRYSRVDVEARPYTDIRM